jgi:cellulose synthase/poly-beta-1,6-N-acetylglucosamine synthase-like glycosyltransferase
LFCPEALVTSIFPESSEGIQTQRTRWEHGHLALILSDVPRLLLESLTTHNVGLMTLALDLSVPPLALLMLLMAVVWLASVLFLILAKAQFPFVIATTAAVLLALSVLLSWRRYGRNIISLGSLAYALIYAVWKIPLYLRFLVSRQRVWTRSKRDEDQP